MKNSWSFVYLSLAFVAVLAIISCQSAKIPAPEQPPSEGKLYDRLGQKEGIEKVVDALLKRVLSDSEIRPFFAITANHPKRAQVFKTQLIDFLCQKSGGPCTYGGKPMTIAHKNMSIEEHHFKAFMNDLTLALNDCKVAEHDQKIILSGLNKTKGSIVEVH